MDSRKLITGTQENLIVCDNESCDYKIENETKDPNVDISSFINKPCPKCGENLLTEEAYATHMNLLNFVKAINSLADNIH